MPYQKNPPKRWPARDEVRALARQFTVKAMNRLIELMDSKSHFVSVNAARTVLVRGDPEPRRNPRFKRIGQRGVKEVNVKIMRFGQEKQGGKRKRDRKLPVVPRRRKGPRDAGDGDGAGLPALPGQREGVRDQPAIADRTETGVPGAGATARHGRGAAATRTDGEVKKGGQS